MRDRNLLAAILESLGYASELAGDGVEALKKLDSSVDLVLLDVQMPEMDGFEVARRMRAHPECGDVPIIMVTILNEREDRIRGVTAGANDFISKPIDRTELQVRIGSLLKMKEARDQLRQSEEKYRTLVETLKDVIWTVDPQLRYTYVSPSVANVRGYSVEETMRMHPLDDLMPESRAIAAQALRIEPMAGALPAGEHTSHTVELQRRHKDGAILWEELTITPLRGGDGRFQGILGVSNDITESKRLEEELRKASEDLEHKVAERTAELADSEERYRALFENMSNGVAIYRAVEDGDDFIIIDFNRAAEIITGRTREEVLDRSVREVFPGIESFGLLDVLKRVRTTGEPDHHPIGKYQDGRIEVWTENSLLRLPSGELVAFFRDETERKRAEEALRASEEKYRGLVETAPIGILSVDTAGGIREVNRKLLEILGSPSAGDTKFINMISFQPLVDAGISEVFLRCMGEGTGQSRETPYISKWGKKSFLRVLLTPLFDDNGAIDGCQAVVEDVTERKTAEEELRESRRMLETILAAVPVGIHLARDRRIQWANEAWRRTFGFEREDQYAGQSARILYAGEREFDLVGDKLEGDLVSGDVTIIEARLRRLNGTTFDAIMRIAALDPGDVTRGIIAAIADVSETKRAQEALRESERKYRATFDNAAVGIGLVDGYGRFIEVNEFLASFLGRTQDEMRNLDIFDLTHPDDVNVCVERYGALVRGEIESYELEKRYMREDGGVVWGDISMSALRAADGEYRAAVGVIADITARRRSEEVRRRLATAVEQAAEAIVMTDTQGTMTYVNPAFARATGYSREEAAGMNARILKSGVHDDLFYRDLWRTITGGDVWRGHLTNKRKDGTIFEEEATISPIKDDSGKIVNYVAVKRDVTTEMSLQSQLIQAQKMEAIGTLAGGIAHDFNNLLQVTLGYSELLLADKKEKDAQYLDLMKIFQAAKSGSDLVRRLLTFSRGGSSKPVPMDLNRQIVQVENLLRRTILRMINIRLELADDLARINADPTQVEQVLMNLAVNARDAMPDGGSLTLITKSSVLDEEFCKAHVGAQPGEYVLLTVSDSGHGMDRSVLERIYEPFFSTKELGRGTGLGLPMVYGIVKHHQGYIACHSEMGKGTTFEVYWPAISSAAELTAIDTAHTARGGNETILLVDDEESVRDLTRRLLSRAGYRVITAENGREALNIFLQERSDISLVIMDLNMPVMGGKDCLKELFLIDPEVKALVASGYSSGVVRFEAGELGAKGFVRKPFRVEQLLRLIRQVLDEC